MNKDTARIAKYIGDPYDIRETSDGNPRIHAYRRIALAAHAMGWDIKTTTQNAMVTLGWPRGVSSVSDLTMSQLRRVATAFEQIIDAR